MTKKEILNKLNGQMVKREYVNIQTVDDIDNIRNELILMLQENNFSIDVLEENENYFTFKDDTMQIRKPKAKNGIGLFELRSKDYTFLLNNTTSKSYGDIPKNENMEILENGFINILEKLENGEIKGIKYTLI